MRREDRGIGGPVGPLAVGRKAPPIEVDAASDQLGGVGLEAARYRAAPTWEYNPPALTHHRLVLSARPPEEMDLRCEGGKRPVPPPAGSIFLLPAGGPGRARWHASP